MKDKLCKSPKKIEAESFINYFNRLVSISRGICIYVLYIRVLVPFNKFYEKLSTATSA